MPTTPRSVGITDQLTRALGEAVIRLWSNLPQDVQDHLFKEAVTSEGESIRSQLAFSCTISMSAHLTRWASLAK
jgi:hypothetical protein